MSDIQLQATIPESLDGYRLDQALATLFPQYSRAQHQTWIKKGQATLNGAQHRPKDKVQTDQLVVIAAALTTSDRWQAQEIPLKIIFEDAHILIIDKPAGLVVHPGAGNPDQTLMNALLHYDTQLQGLPRAGIVHRLDKDTSGLLVIARSLEAHHSLVKAMQERHIKREYEAIVQGVMIAGGQIEAPIGRHPTRRTQMSIVASGRAAITHYRILKRFSAYTHLRVILETGRTHQIRVHFQSINYPLVGDKIYFKRPKIAAGLSKEARKIIANFPRQALHASQLSLEHPITGEPYTWRSELPQDIRQLLAALEDKQELPVKE